MSGEAIATSTIDKNLAYDPTIDNEFADDDDLIKTPIPSTLNIDNDALKSNDIALQSLNK
jgi:hypothetical protein